MKNLMKKMEKEINERDLKNLLLWLTTEKRFNGFKKYVENMNNNSLQFDCIAYRQLVLDNRVIDLDKVKSELRGKKLDKHIWSILKNLLLEDLSFAEASKIMQTDTDKFIDFWDKKRGLNFNNLMLEYKIKLGVAA